MPIFGFQSLLQNPGSETHKVCNRYSLAFVTPKPFLDRLIPGPFWGKAQHIFRIPCTNPDLYDVFLVLVWPYKFPRHLINVSKILKLGEIKDLLIAPGLCHFNGIVEYWDDGIMVKTHNFSCYLLDP
jgi:hypothetical protein